MKLNIPTCYVHCLNELSVQFFEYINNEDNYVTNNNKTQKTQIGQHKENNNECQLFIFLQVWGHLQNMSTVFVRTRVKQQLMALHYTNIKQFAKTFWLG